MNKQPVVPELSAASEGEREGRGVAAMQEGAAVSRSLAFGNA